MTDNIVEKLKKIKQEQPNELNYFAEFHNFLDQFINVSEYSKEALFDRMRIEHPIFFNRYDYLSKNIITLQNVINLLYSSELDDNTILKLSGLVSDSPITGDDNQTTTTNGGGGGDLIRIREIFNAIESYTELLRQMVSIQTLVSTKLNKVYSQSYQVNLVVDMDKKAEMEQAIKMDRRKKMEQIQSKTRQNTIQESLQQAIKPTQKMKMGK